MIDFTAIDFETAQGPRWSACAVGLVHYKNGVPDFEYESLIQPPGNEYFHRNIEIHGITPQETVNAREFPAVWLDIKKYIVNQTIVAHNVDFDRDVLVKSLSFYNLPVPKLDCQCTYELFGYKLDEVCQAFGIPLMHHSPLSDAKACGQLYINYHMGILPSSPISKIVRPTMNEYHQRISGVVLQPDLKHADPDNVFFGKKVVITGVFESFDREFLALSLQQKGADVDTTVNKRTDFVIAGKDPGYKKMERAKTLNQQGCTIRVITEIDLLDKIKPGS